MAKCKECGLPIKVCNTLATYRLAIDNYKMGRPDVALEYADSGKQHHDAYMAEYRANSDRR